jgi:hypothetical protein
MNLRESFQWIMLLYGVKCKFMDCRCRHEGKFSFQKLGALSDLQDPLYMANSDIKTIHPGHHPIIRSIIRK